MKRPEDNKDVHTQTPGTPDEIKNIDHGQRQLKDISTSTSDSVGTSTVPVPETKDEENYRKTKRYCDEVIKKYLQGHFDECDALERDQLLKNATKNKIIDEPEFEVIDGIDTETAPGTSRPNNCHLPDKDAEIKDNDPCFTFISNKKLDKKPTKLNHPQWVNKNILIREPVSDVPYLNFKNKQQQTNVTGHNIKIEDSEESGSSFKEEENKKVKENKNVATEPEKLSRYFSIIGLKKTIDKEQNTEDDQESSLSNSATVKNNKKTNKKKAK